MDEQKVPEFTDVQRAWLADVHGVTLDVTLRPGMWIDAYPNRWLVTGFERSAKGPEVLAVCWLDPAACWAESLWLEATGVYVEVDPPESWDAAGRLGAIDDEPDQWRAERWRDAVGRALYGGAWDTDDLADGISDLIPLIRSVEDWKAHAIAIRERDHLKGWKESALEQFGRWDEVFDMVDDGSPSNLGRLKQDIVAEKIDLIRGELARLRSAIDERPSGVWKCTEHGGVSIRPDDPGVAWCAYANPARNGLCRWVELVYPASEGQ